MDLRNLTNSLRQNFPDWAIVPYDIPDMWSGINITPPSHLNYDVKILDQGILVDHGVQINQSELDSLLSFLKTLSCSVQARLINR